VRRLLNAWFTPGPDGSEVMSLGHIADLGLVLGGRTGIRYLRHDAMRDVHLQVLMHVHPDRQRPYAG
jgi:hypothetical protein